MKSKSLPNEFWAVIIVYVVYILNRSPINMVKNIILQEA